MSPFQQQVIDTTLAEFDRNRAIQEQRSRDQQAQLGVLGAGRAGVQLAEFQTGSDRDRAALQAQLLSQGFGQAQQAAQQALANQLGLAGAQQQQSRALQDLSRGQFGQAGFQTGLSNFLASSRAADIRALGGLGSSRQGTQAQLTADQQRHKQQPLNHNKVTTVWCWFRTSSWLWCSTSGTTSSTKCIRQSSWNCIRCWWIVR